MRRGSSLNGGVAVAAIGGVNVATSSRRVGQVCGEGRGLLPDAQPCDESLL